MMFIVTGGMIRGGIVPSILFPKSDNNLQATIAFPDGTTAEETDNATRQMEEALKRVSARIVKARSENPESLSKTFTTLKWKGRGRGRFASCTVMSAQSPICRMLLVEADRSHVGQIFVELFDTEIRDIHSDDLLNMWREEARHFPRSGQNHLRVCGCGARWQSNRIQIAGSQ